MRRLLAAQALVVAAGSGTLLLVALSVAPTVFRSHVTRALGEVSETTGAHLDEAFARAVLVSLGIAVVAAALTALTGSIVVSRRLARPLEQLSVAATKVAAGAYATRVPAYRLGSEVAALAAAFNAMAHRLHETERARRGMLADLAHELRTPVATIESYLEALDDGVVPADAETWQTLRTQTQRLRRLVDDMGTVSTAEERSIDLALVPLDLRDVVVAAAADAAVAYEAKGVTLTVAADDAAVPVLGDAARLREVIDNLLTNAVRHTPSGGRVRVSVTLRGGTVRIVVTDDGEGIAAHHLPHVFDRFYRGDPARSRDTGGSGIGLAIVRALVEAHGGTVLAYSDGPGRGARFVVTLPGGVDSPLATSATGRRGDGAPAGP